jgi:hypothetical protein
MGDMSGMMGGGAGGDFGGIDFSKLGGGEGMEGLEGEGDDDDDDEDDDMPALEGEDDDDEEEAAPAASKSTKAAPKIQEVKWLALLAREIIQLWSSHTKDHKGWESMPGNFESENWYSSMRAPLLLQSMSIPCKAISFPSKSELSSSSNFSSCWRFNVWFITILV